MLHEGFAAADGEASFHGLETTAVLVYKLHGSREGHGHSIGELPCVRVMAKDATELATGKPGDKSYSWAVDCGAGCKGMNKTPITGLQSLPNIRFADFFAQRDAQIVRAGNQWNIRIVNDGDAHKFRRRHGRCG